MSLLPIITLPDPVLRTISTPVEHIDANLKRLVNNMFETMYDAPGVGLAAIQVGVPKRLLVLDVADDDEGKQPLVLINPKILKLGAVTRVYEEGCLSLPDIRLDIERPTTVTLEYTDIDGTLHVTEADGLLATSIQHEIDHLDGKLIVDYLTRLKRDMIIRKFKKQARIS